MTLTYEILGKPIPDGEGGYDGYETDGEFEYEVEPTMSDFLEYLAPDHPDGLTKEEMKMWARGSYQALENLLNDFDFFQEYLRDEDEDFYNFMHERYYDEAMKELEDTLDD